MQGFNQAPVPTDIQEQVTTLNNNINGNFATDCNSVETGKIQRFRFNSSTLNTPYKQGITAFSEGWVESYLSNANYGIQTAYATGNDEYTRILNNGTWGNWYSVNKKVTNLERGPVAIGEFSGTTETSKNLEINADNFRLLAFLIYDSGGKIVNSVVAPPLGFRNITAKIYGESSSQWGSMLLASDYASATFNRTSATTTKVRLYGIY